MSFAQISRYQGMKCLLKGMNVLLAPEFALRHHSADGQGNVGLKKPAQRNVLKLGVFGKQSPFAIISGTAILFLVENIKTGAVF